MAHKRLGQFAPAAISLLLLAGLSVERVFSHVPPGDAQRYHAAVRQAVANAPMRMGDWIGRPVETPVQLWSQTPNALLARNYINAHTGHRATVVLAQVCDAREMITFDPAHAYAARGFSMLRQKALQLTVEGRVVDCGLFEFENTQQTPWRRMTVACVYILPDGVLSPARGLANRAASHYTGRYFGVAQLHVLLDEDIPASQRDETISQMIAGHMPVIRLMEAESSR